MKKTVAILTALALGIMIFAAIPMKVSAAAEIRNFGPKKGRSGLPVNIIGNGFEGASKVRVKFGSTEATKTEVKNDQHIKTEVPDLSLLDNNPVKVTLFLDEAPVEGDMWFEYDPPGPDPLISGLNPETAQAGTEFSMEIVGANFMTPHGRVPNQILLSGPVAVFWGTIISNSATDTSFTAEFYLPPATMPGEYSILVGFSDGASTEAQGFQVIP